MKQQENQGKTIPTGIIIIMAIGMLILGFSAGTINCMINIDAECQNTQQKCEYYDLGIFNQTSQYNQNLEVPENLTIQQVS